MINVFTHAVRRGRYSACAQASPDDPRSNFPPTRLGVSHSGRDERDVALKCARKAVRVLKPYMSELTAVDQIGAGIWLVYFKKEAA